MSANVLKVVVTNRQQSVNFQMAHQNNKVAWKTNKQVKCGEARRPFSQQHLSTSSAQVFVSQLNKVASTGENNSSNLGDGVLGSGSVGFVISFSTLAVHGFA